MWPNRYWAGTYWADRYWPIGEGDAPEPPASQDDRRYVIGMGQGKTRVHPHPMFSRVKQ